MIRQCMPLKRRSERSACKVITPTPMSMGSKSCNFSKLNGKVSLMACMKAYIRRMVKIAYVWLFVKQWTPPNHI